MYKSFHFRGQRRPVDWRLIHSVDIDDVVCFTPLVKEWERKGCNVKSKSCRDIGGGEPLC